MPAPQKNNRRDRNNNKPQHRINEQIRCREVRIVGDDVESEVMPTRQAIQLAQQKGVDLVEISPNAVPPVCRLINYSKFLYQQKKRQKELKAKQVKIEVKEIRFGPQTDEHDYNFKLKHANHEAGGAGCAVVSVWGWRESIKSLVSVCTRLYCGHSV